jgi:hypothetical protein
MCTDKLGTVDIIALTASEEHASLFLRAPIVASSFSALPPHHIAKASTEPVSGAFIATIDGRIFMLEQLSGSSYEGE